MEKEFISYTEALALKKLGFNEPCFGFFYEDEEFELCPVKNNNLMGYTNAPLYQQAFRWFREKYNIQLGICHIHGKFDCWTNDGDLFENGKYCNFKTYEEAELECLKKLIEIVKNK